MIVGFKGEESRLKSLYKELGLKEVKVNSFEDIANALSENDGNTVLTNYNEIMVFEQPTADLIEKRIAIIKMLESTNKKVYLTLTKNDPSLDKVPLDYHICTKVDSNDKKFLEDIFGFVNTDLPFSGKLADDEYAVRAHDEVRAEAKKISEVKKLIR